MDEHQVICINANFPSDTLAFWKIHSVQYPQQDKIYSIRDVVRHSNGDVGLWLTEIINPTVPIKHPVLGIIQMEPTFSIKRFAHLDSSPLTWGELREMVKQANLNKLLNF